MKFELLHVYTLLSLALVGSHAVSPEVYWKSILPDSPMPKAIKDLLHTKAWDDGKKKVSTDIASPYIKLKNQPDESNSYVASKDEPKDEGHFYWYDASMDQLQDHAKQFYWYGAAEDHPNKFYWYAVPSDQLKDHPGQFYRYGAPSDRQKDHPGQFYWYAASKDQLKDHPGQFYWYGAAKDHPSQFYWYATPNDQLKDHPGQFYWYATSKDKLQEDHLEKNAESKDQVKDHLKQFYWYGTSKDELKDKDQLNELKDHPGQFYWYAASEDKLQEDHPEQNVESKDQVKDKFYWYAESKDQVKGHPNQFYWYGATKDHPHQFYWYGASKDEVKDKDQPKELKDHPNQFYWYVGSKDQVKGHPNQFYWYAESKDEVKDNPQQLYWYGLSNNQQKDNPIAKLLFLEKDLHQGEEMKLHFMKNNQKTAFLPQSISDSIPFSSKDLLAIYNKFSINPKSLEAEVMKQTLSLCEHKGIEGEETFCASSLESMVNFSTTKLGKKVKALSTEVNAKESTPSQKYKIELVRKLAATKAVVCHRQNYAYAVFYCHISVGTRSYAVSLEGADGTTVKSVAVCHTDTSKWNPKHLAFQLLNVTAGTVPVCHFLPEDHVLWVPY